MIISHMSFEVNTPNASMVHHLKYGEAEKVVGK
jgi:hypothetical protein